MLGPQAYLYGVGEVPSSWPMQVLETQALAARTYAFEKVARLGQHRPTCNCGLYASTLDQNYVGWDKESGSMGNRWVDAVVRTADQVVKYKGSLIQAYYHSSSGGFTENNENVWGGSAIPYLRGVCDPGDFSSANPVRTWTLTFTDAAITKKLARYTGSIGTVTGFSGIVRGVSSRIKSITVAGTSKKAAISGGLLFFRRPALRRCRHRRRRNRRRRQSRPRRSRCRPAMSRTGRRAASRRRHPRSGHRGQCHLRRRRGRDRCRSNPIG